MIITTKAPNLVPRGCDVIVSVKKCNKHTHTSKISVDAIEKAKSISRGVALESINAASNTSDLNY